MKTQEELRVELNNQTLEVETVMLMLDKASMLLNHWSNEYTFVEKPDPREALKMTSMGERGRHAEESVKWFHEYTQIIGFVGIAYDYIFESRKLLEKAVYGDKKTA